MTKLNQIIAIENGVKKSAERDLTDAYHALQKPEMLLGIARTYTPLDDADSERLPPESKHVQATIVAIMAKAAEVMTKHFDVTATKDYANCTAFADVVLDGKALLHKVPVSHLLFLEKRLVEIETVVKKLPTLDPAERWSFDSAQNAYATTPTETKRTKKVMKNHVKAVATDKHPAQVETFTEDVQAGTWKTIKYSGAIPSKTVAEVLARIVRLREAVKFAREEANNATVEMKTVGKPIFDFLFAPLGETA